MKIRIPKKMYDEISEFALENDMTFDEAIVLCFRVGEMISNPSMQTQTPSLFGKNYEPYKATEDGEA